MTTEEKARIESRLREKTEQWIAEKMGSLPETLLRINRESATEYIDDLLNVITGYSWEREATMAALKVPYWDEKDNEIQMYEIRWEGKHGKEWTDLYTTLDGFLDALTANAEFTEINFLPRFDYTKGVWQNSRAKWNAKTKTTVEP